MKRHKVDTRPRNGGYLAACRDCDAITFGGFPTRTAAREALTGHEHEETPGAAPTATEGQESAPNHYERPEFMTTVSQHHADHLASLLALFQVETTLDPAEPAERLQSMRLVVSSNITSCRYAIDCTTAPDGTRLESWTIGGEEPSAPIGFEVALQFEYDVLTTILTQSLHMNLAQVAQVIGVAALTRATRGLGE